MRNAETVLLAFGQTTVLHVKAFSHTAASESPEPRGLKGGQEPDLMKKLLFLMILGTAGWYGWQYYLAEPESESEPETATEDGAAPGAAEGSGASALQAQLQGQKPALPKPVADTKAEAEKLWDEIQAAGKDPALDARAPLLAKSYSAVLQALYEQPGSEDAQQRLIDERLQALADKLFFSKMKYIEDPTGIFSTHTIQPGELLDNIGREYGISYQMLNLMRGVEPENSNYPQGLVLKVYDAKESGYLLHIDKSSFLMDVFIAGIFAKRFPVGIGEPVSETPTGTTFIEARERGETGVQWTDPESGVTYQAGEEGNILGRFWMRFNSEIGRSGLGIHGYTGAGTVTGAKVSNGCIRMRNEDAELVYHMLVPCLYSRSGEFITRAPMTVQIVD